MNVADARDDVAALLAELDALAALTARQGAWRLFVAAVRLRAELMSGFGLVEDRPC